MKKILLLLIVSYKLTYANPIDVHCPQFILNGAPITSVDGQFLCRTNYALHYRNSTKTPEYVTEHVTKESVTGTAKRKNNFRADPDIESQYQSHLTDYDGTHYDRGHMAPAGDNTQNSEIMSESFLLSNMVPQDQENNRGPWKQIETLVRNWVLDNHDIYVISGTIYKEQYKTIGNGVGVPNQLWKVIIDNTNNVAIGFLIPNTSFPVHDIIKYTVNIETIENETGLNFMPLLTDNSIEKSISFNNWNGLQ